ncbi:hypothetical protein HD806DRAFT_496238 [Xylariaceae sp. AK1471]|nr:hypothetical protein HD806DRAFT_496238 [Xylariaceae sp. AK1471]
MPAGSPAQFPPGYLEENNGGRVIAATTTILVVSTILFALRLISRSLTTAKRGWDDHLLIAAYFALLGVLTILYVDVTHAGLGRHVAAVVMEDPNKLTRFFLLLYILELFYALSVMLSRVSVVILYLRIFTTRSAQIACWATIAYLVANCVAAYITAQLECMPLAYAWDKSIEGGTCFDEILWFELTNILNIVGDVMVLLLPLKTVWGLHTSTSKRVGIVAVLLTGSIGVIASSVRTSVFFEQADVIKTDPTFPDAFSWTAVECGFYFSAACLVGVRPFFVHMSNLIKGRKNPSSANTESGRGLDSDAIHLKKHYRSDYTTIDGDDDAYIRPLGPTAYTAHHHPSSSL